MTGRRASLAPPAKHLSPAARQPLAPRSGLSSENCR